MTEFFRRGRAGKLKRPRGHSEAGRNRDDLSAPLQCITFYEFYNPLAECAPLIIYAAAAVACVAYCRVEHYTPGGGWPISERAQILIFHDGRAITNRDNLSDWLHG